MTSEQDKKNREELKTLIEDIFKKDEKGKLDVMKFIDTLENGRLDNLLKKIKKNFEDNPTN